MSTLTLFGDDIEPFQMPTTTPVPRPVPACEETDAWVKSWADGRVDIPLPTLMVIPFDAHTYRPARFRFVPGVRVDVYAASKLPGVRVDGESSLISLYEAAHRGLATEIPLRAEALP